MTDAADGGFAVAAAGEASYRVIDINDRPNSAALHSRGACFARARAAAGV